MVVIWKIKMSFVRSGEANTLFEVKIPADYTESHFLDFVPLTKTAVPTFSISGFLRGVHLIWRQGGHIRCRSAFTKIPWLWTTYKRHTINYNINRKSIKNWIENDSFHKKSIWKTCMKQKRITRENKKMSRQKHKSRHWRHISQLGWVRNDRVPH